MTSLFSPTRPTFRLPVICIKPRAGLPAPYVAGMPNYLHAIAWWKESTESIDLAESFPLAVDLALPGWSGGSGDSGLNLQAAVKRLPAANRYDLAIALRRDLDVLDDDSWHNVFIAPGPPFDSGMLHHVYLPAIDTNGLQVID